MRLRTTSDHYPTRLFLQLFSILAYNLWMLLRALRAVMLLAPAFARRVEYLLRDFRDDLVAVFGK